MKYENPSTGDLKDLILKGALVLVGVIFVLAIYQWISSPLIVSVTGVGEVTVPAESATISFSVAGSDANVATAISNVKAKADSLRSLLKNSGIPESDIVESQVQVVPASSLVQGATGYQAVITMGAKTVHVKDIGNLIASLYASGAVVVSQPTLSVEKIQDLEKKAYDEAVKDAKKQAADIGGKNWKLFRKIIAISQQTSPTTSTVTTKSEDLTSAQGEAGKDTFKVVKAVSVSYKMW